MIKAYRISLVVLSCLIVAGCASMGPAPKPYDASRTTDGALGCDEISGEVDETNRSMRTTAQALATMERHNEKQVMKGLAIGLLTGPIIAQSLVGPEKDTISKHNEIRRMAARNILLANLAAQKDCNPVQALSGDGALYEQGIYRTEEDRFGNPDDERLNAPKPLMFVVAEDNPSTPKTIIPPINPAAAPSSPHSSAKKPKSETPPLSTSSTTSPAPRISKKELMRQFQSGEISQTEYLERRRR